MKVHILFIFLITVLFCIDVNGQKKKIPKSSVEDRVILRKGSTVFEFYTRKSPNKFKPLLDKSYYTYRPDTVLKTQGAAPGKLLHGQFKIFYPNSNLKELSNYNLGLKNGVEKHWNFKGELTDFYTWKNGVLNGEFIEYGPSGIAVRKGKYKNGNIEGVVTTYTPQGPQNERYKNGILIPADSSTRNKKKP